MSLFPTVATSGGEISTSESKKNLLKQMAGAGGGGGKSFVKFTKQGEWLAGVDGDDISGRQFAFNVASLETGYIGWCDGSVVDEIMAPLEKADTLPPKSTLPAIEAGEGNGWSGQLTIMIKDVESGDEHLAKGSSGGFIRRLSEFMGELYDTVDENGDNQLDAGNIPVVQLDCGGYKHKKYGWINEPKFVLVDWLDSDGTPVGMAEEEEDPLPKSTPKKKTASKARAKLV